MKVLCVLGTRPEVIKLAPVVRALRERNIPLQICSTRQHDRILDDMLREREMVADFSSVGVGPYLRSLSLNEQSARMLNYLNYVIPQSKAELVLVQGDTTSALCGALASFYCGANVGHVEAGLRTENASEPFPEEMNRRLISQIAYLHFAPTKHAYANLLEDGVRGEIVMTGNTIVDELLRWLPEITPWESEYERLVLVTAHRRERQKEKLTLLREQLVYFASRHRDTLVLWPVHPNPAVQEIAHAGMRPPNLALHEPLLYHEFLSALKRADLVVTDSGGVIEEATTVRCPTIIIRDHTERLEALSHGAVLVPFNDMMSLHATMHTMLSRRRWSLNTTPNYVFGDGDAGIRIAKAVQDWLQ
jgi:UDP-N-acetylglucosamine 2-epimerase (non-hydrolysing)